MRKIFLFILLVSGISTLSANKEKTYLSVRFLYPYFEVETNVYEDDTIKVNFDVTEKSLVINIYNKTKNRIYIEWENFRIDDSAIAFDTDRRIKMDEPKADEVIFPQSSSTHNNILPKKAIEDSYIINYWGIDRIKKMGEQFSKIIVPIRIGDSSVDYIFQIGVACIVEGIRTKVNCPNIETIQSISEGMKYEDVLSLIGYPSYFTQIEKSFTAHYFNGLSIEFCTALKGHAIVLSHFWTPNTLNIGLVGRKKTKVTKIDTSQLKDISPEIYYQNLYK